MKSIDDLNKLNKNKIYYDNNTKQFIRFCSISYEYGNYPYKFKNINKQIISYCSDDYVTKNVYQLDDYEKRVVLI